jgi:hypothetical protein
MPGHNAACRTRCCREHFIRRFMSSPPHHALHTWSKARAGDLHIPASSHASLPHAPALQRLTRSSETCPPASPRCRCRRWPCAVVAGDGCVWVAAAAYPCKPACCCAHYASSGATKARFLLIVFCGRRQHSDTCIKLNSVNRIKFHFRAATPMVPTCVRGQYFANLLAEVDLAPAAPAPRFSVAFLFFPARPPPSPSPPADIHAPPSAPASSSESMSYLRKSGKQAAAAAAAAPHVEGP